MRKSFLPFSPPLISDEEIQEVANTLRSEWITTGPKVASFEEEFARFVGAPGALALSSGTAALHVALLALGIGPQDPVITTPLTFCATVHAIEHLGARPILVDVEPDTLNIDPARVAKVLRERRFESRRHVRSRAARRRKEVARGVAGGAGAILPVHLYGHPCNLDALAQIARESNFALVEDAAHALPARYKQRSVGSLNPLLPHSNAICFSFYATKNLTTAEGGMLTGPHELLDEARLWSQHGISRDAYGRSAKSTASGSSWKYQVTRAGFKYNMTDIQAAIGLHQLKKLPAFHARRRHIASRYTTAFSVFEELQTPAERAAVDHAWHLYVLRLNMKKLRISRDQFIEELKARKIASSVHFIPVHLHPYYRKKYGYRANDFPIAYREYQRMVSLPLHLRMTDDDVEDVIQAVTDMVRRNRRHV